MPSNLRKAVASEPVSERTVLFPPVVLVPVPAPIRRVPLAGTSSRRQWLVQVKGPLGRRRRIVEFGPDQGQITLGSGTAAKCQVLHTAVSRLHAALVRRPHRGVYLMDLGSREGTYLNGERLSGELLLMDGDRISLGRKVEFEFLDGPRPQSKVRRWARWMGFAAAGLDEAP